MTAGTKILIDAPSRSNLRSSSNWSEALGSRQGCRKHQQSRRSEVHPPSTTSPRRWVGQRCDNTGRSSKECPRLASLGSASLTWVKSGRGGKSEVQRVIRCLLHVDQSKQRTEGSHSDFHVDYYKINGRYYFIVKWDPFGTPRASSHHRHRSPIRPSASSKHPRSKGRSLVSQRKAILQRRLRPEETARSGAGDTVRVPRYYYRFKDTDVVTSSNSKSGRGTHTINTRLDPRVKLSPL